MNNNPADIKKRLIHLTQQLVAEMEVLPNHREVSLQDSLQSQLGIDSISRGELAGRIEKEFHVELPLQKILAAKTLADLFSAITAASPMTASFNNATVDLSSLAELTSDVSHASSLQEVLMLHAQAAPDRPHMYLLDEKGHEEVMTYHQLFTQAKRVAAHLIQRGLEPHDTVAIMLPTEAGFFYSFIGILLAGGVPVPIYPPARAHQLEEYAKKEIGILNNAGIRFLITFPEAKRLSQFLQPFVPTLKEVLTVAELLTDIPETKIYLGQSSDIALLQYTSGSTSQPKGVTLTHFNLLSNIRSFGEAIQITPQDICVSWLPLYHDLGLIGNWLGSLYFGLRLIAFSPLLFLSRPERWLWAIHHHRATLSAGPNFAYELCVRKITPELIEGLNLRSWRLAINGAEIIHPKTVHGFTEKFSAYGFQPEAFFPVYGLAENALGLTTPAIGSRPKIDTIERKTLENNGQAIPTTATHDTKTFLQLVGCGKPLPHHEIRIVDPEDHVLPERTVGYIQFRGPSSMQGYYHNPTATQHVFHAGWWDTGDLGYLAEGNIFITGRSKDIIIKAGRNLSATEIENCVNSCAGIRQGCVIAFSVNDEEKKTEKLIIVAESTVSRGEQDALVQVIQEKVVSTLDVAPDEIILVAPRIVPKTSSGKLQRNACKMLYQKNKLQKKTLPAAVQYAKIGIKSFFTQCKNRLYQLSCLLYTAYIGIVFAITFLPVWLIIHLASPNITAHIVQKWMRFLTIISFCPQRIKRSTLSRSTRSMIFAANHCSYLDVVVLLGVLPPGTRFVAKRSLFKVPILKTFLLKLNHIPVDKEDPAKGMADMQRITETLQQGNSILIFPEGTFSHAAGLRPFKLSAFKMATDFTFPICPVAINGTRHILRGNSLVIKPHRLIVTLSDPCYAEGKK